jgi:hypothetical protein
MEDTNDRCFLQPHDLAFHLTVAMRSDCPTKQPSPKHEEPAFSELFMPRPEPGLLFAALPHLNSGQAAVEIAAEIMKEAQQLAAGLRANGRKMSEHLQEFGVLANKVSTAMRDTRAEVLSSREHPLPTATMLAPPTGAPS